MTDNQLPNADINRDLALRAGWKHWRDQGVTRGGVVCRWRSPTGSWHEHPPDFCGDWNYTGPLLVELVHKYIVDLYDEFKDENGDSVCMCELSKGMDGPLLSRGVGATLPTAIARAAHAMGEEEE